jgi:hypothetical protein
VCSASASTGGSQRCARISEPSTFTSGAPSTVARKNQVSKRFGETSGVIQREIGTSASGARPSPASSWASRTAARRAAPTDPRRAAVRRVHLAARKDQGRSPSRGVRSSSSTRGAVAVADHHHGA